MAFCPPRSRTGFTSRGGAELPSWADARIRRSPDHQHSKLVHRSTGPPRAHGEVLEDRAVSFLELFYDLVFVVLIAQIAHTLAGDVSWAGFGRFAVVFSLIWVAWVNGSFYHELHGRDDGRSRASPLILASGLAVTLSAVWVEALLRHAHDGTPIGQL